MQIQGYLYFGQLIFTVMLAFYNYRVGKCNVDRILSKICTVTFFVVSLYLYYASINAIDSTNYEIRFEFANSITVSVDYLFMSFIKFVKKFTDNYKIFRCIVGCVYLFPIFLILKKENKGMLNVPLFLMFCLIFPFFQNIVALKFTMASSISISALYLFLKSNQTKKNVIGTIIVILISSMLHDTTIIYLIIFILFLFYKKIKNKKIMTFFLIIFDAVLILLLRVGALSKIVNSLVGETNTFYIKKIETAGFGFIISIFLHVAFVFLLEIAIRKKIDNHVNDCNYTDNGWKNVSFEPIYRDDNIMILNYCSLILIPLYSINTICFRLFRGMLLLNYIVIGECYSKKNKDIILFGIILLEVTCMLFDANGIGSIISVIK